MKQGGEAGGKGEERYSVKAQLQTSLLCWMKAELQLVGAFRVLFMGCTEERRTVLQSHLCHTSHNYSFFSKNVVCNGWLRQQLHWWIFEARGSMERAQCTRHVTVKRGHNLHKPANCHLTVAWLRVYFCYSGIVYGLCSGFVFFQSAVWQPSIKLHYQSQQFSVCIIAVGAKKAWCSDSSSEKKVLHLAKSCAYSKTNNISRLVEISQS